MVLGFFAYLGGLGTFGQVLIALPMVLDLLGEATTQSCQA